MPNHKKPKTKKEIEARNRNIAILVVIICIVVLVALFIIGPILWKRYMRYSNETARIKRITPDTAYTSMSQGNKFIGNTQL